MIRRLTIHQSGLHLSIQDHGRKGFQSLGVPESGALNHDARLIGNALVGNAANDAVLETCAGGLSLSCDDAMRIALTGTLTTTLTIQDDQGTSLTVPAHRSVDVVPGRIVSLGPLKDSFSATIAIAGGIDVPLLYGARSTSPNAMIGGHEGRLLAAGDILPLGRPDEAIGSEKAAILDAILDTTMDTSTTFRVVMGPQDDRFTNDARAMFLTESYRISPVFNRMGMRLDGPPLAHIDDADILSDGIVAGAIQVPGNGLPIILLADHQTTGGYTKIATVISADLPRLACMMPGQMITFHAVDITAAEAAARQHADAVATVITTITDAPPLIDLGALYTLGDTT